MAHVKVVWPAWQKRQIDVNSLLSEGIGVLTSVLGPTATNTGAITATDAGLDTSASVASTFSADTFSSSTTDTPASSSIVSSSSPPTATAPLATSTPLSTFTSRTSLLSSNTSDSASLASSTSTPAASKSSNKNTLAIALGTVLGFVTLALILLLVWLYLRRRRRAARASSSPSPSSSNDSYIAVGEEAAKEPSESTARSTAPSFRDDRHIHPAMRESRQPEFYPPLPPPHQMASLGRRHSEYAPAYIPNDPFEDGSRAMFGHEAHNRSRSRHSIGLNPVREVPERNSWENRPEIRHSMHDLPSLAGTPAPSLDPPRASFHEAQLRPRASSDPRLYGRRRWSAMPGSGLYGANRAPRYGMIPRKPVPGVGPDGWFERRDEVTFDFKFPPIGCGPLNGNPVNGNNLARSGSLRGGWSGSPEGSPRRVRPVSTGFGGEKYFAGP